MECQKKVLVICGEWSDIYGWGKGFYTREKAIKWNTFWDEFKSFKKENSIVFWDCNNDNFYKTPYLFTTQGCIYVHPMNFTAYLVCDVSYSYDDLVSELNKICQSVAEVCEGRFNMVLEEKDFTHNLCIADMGRECKNFKVIS